MVLIEELYGDGTWRDGTSIFLVDTTPLSDLDHGDNHHAILDHENDPVLPHPKRVQQTALVALPRPLRMLLAGPSQRALSAPPIEGVRRALFTPACRPRGRAIPPRSPR